jgi:hypothetical protein
MSVVKLGYVGRHHVVGKHRNNWRCRGTEWRFGVRGYNGSCRSRVLAAAPCSSGLPLIDLGGAKSGRVLGAFYARPDARLVRSQRRVR